MRPDLEAAFRLAQQLKVHTHLQGEDRDRRGENMRLHHWNSKPKIRKSPPKVVNGRGRGGCNRMALEIDGVRYESFRQAREVLRVGNVRLADWISSGKAKIL